MVRKDVTPEPRQNHLPHKRAFVVQFSSQTDFAGNKVQGRAEPIASGTVLHFQSSTQLLAFMAVNLQE